MDRQFDKKQVKSALDEFYYFFNEVSETEDGLDGIPAYVSSHTVKTANKHFGGLYDLLDLERPKDLIYPLKSE